MNYRSLGRTGLMVSELCFGAMTFGGRGMFAAVGKLTQSEADKLVAKALDAGVNFFDTADVYSEGDSEKFLGKALGARRKDIVLATKVRGRVGPGPNDIGLSRKHVVEAIDASLARLGMVWSPLAGGFLTDKFASGTGPEDARRAKFDFPPIDKERALKCIAVMKEVGGAHGASVARVALAWLLHQTVVTSVIIGAKTEQQLDDNLKSIDLKLSADEFKRLDEVSALAPEYPGWMLQRFSSPR